jgi:hypothetical protein
MGKLTMGTEFHQFDGKMGKVNGEGFLAGALDIV